MNRENIKKSRKKRVLEQILELSKITGEKVNI